MRHDIRGLLDGNDRFWRTYEPTFYLRGESRKDFLYHDVNNLFSAFFMRLRLFTDADPDAVDELIQAAGDLSHCEVDDGRILDRLDRLDRSMWQIPTTFDMDFVQNRIREHSFDWEPERLIRKVMLFQAIYPTLISSIKFLATPNYRDLTHLLMPTLSLRDLAEYFDAKVHAVTPDEPITGVELIPILNLIQNARKFHTMWEKNHETDQCTDIIISGNSHLHVYAVTNRSSTPLPPNGAAVKLGERGSDGNKGYGLAIADMFTGIMDRRLIQKQTQFAEDDFGVTFGIIPPVQAQ